MRIDLFFLTERFDRFNKTIFNEILPEPKFELCAVKSFLGKCNYKINYQSDGSRRTSGFTLRFNSADELPERTAEDILIHEMIHFFIAYTGLIDNAPHGSLFKALMKNINEVHGRNITISYKRAGTAPQTPPTGLKNRIVAVIEFRNGKYGIGVLPVSTDKVAEYRRRLRTLPDFRKVDFYVTTDPLITRHRTSIRKYSVVEKDFLDIILPNCRHFPL